VALEGNVVACARVVHGAVDMREARHGTGAGAAGTPAEHGKLKFPPSRGAAVDGLIGFPHAHAVRRGADSDYRLATDYI